MRCDLRLIGMSCRGILKRDELDGLSDVGPIALETGRERSLTRSSKVPAKVLCDKNGVPAVKLADFDPYPNLSEIFAQNVSPMSRAIHKALVKGSHFVFVA